MAKTGSDEAGSRPREGQGPARGEEAAAKKVSPIPTGYTHGHAVPHGERRRRRAGLLPAAPSARARSCAWRRPAASWATRRSGIGDSIVMLSDEFPGMSTQKAPTSLGGTTGSLMLYVPNVDAAFKRAVDAGCTSLMAPTDMFWGDRFGKLEDPYGNQWGLATHKEGRAAQADGRAGQGRDGPDGEGRAPDARHPRLRDHRHHQEALHGGQLEPRPRDAARLRPSAHHGALGRRQAGPPDLEAERRDRPDQARRLLPGHGLHRLLRRARPGRPRHGRRPLRRDQRGRAPGLQGRLPARVDREVAVRPREHRRQHAGGDPRGRGAGRRAEAGHHGQGRRLREPLEVHDAHAGGGRRGREGLHHRVREDGGPRRVPAPDPGGRGGRDVREGRA